MLTAAHCISKVRSGCEVRGLRIGAGTWKRREDTDQSDTSVVRRVTKVGWVVNTGIKGDKGTEGLECCRTFLDEVLVILKKDADTNGNCLEWMPTSDVS